MPGIPKMSGAVAVPLPYLRLRRCGRLLLGPAALSWFRAAGRGLGGRSAAVGRAREGAALGAGRPERPGRPGREGGRGEERRPLPAGRWEDGHSGSRLAFVECTLCHFSRPLATSPQGRHPAPPRNKLSLRARRGDLQEGGESEGKETQGSGRAGWAGAKELSWGGQRAMLSWDPRRQISALESSDFRRQSTPQERAKWATNKSRGGVQAAPRPTGPNKGECFPTLFRMKEQEMPSASLSLKQNLKKRI